MHQLKAVPQLLFGNMDCYNDLVITFLANVVFKKLISTSLIIVLVVCHRMSADNT